MIGGITRLAAALLLAWPAAAQTLSAPVAVPDARITAPRLPYPLLAPDTRVVATDDPHDAAAPSDADSAALARLAALRLGQDYEPRPAIWRIGDADTTIYLFGTIHVLPPGFRWRSPALEAVIARSDRLLLETVETPGQRAPASTAPAAPPLPPLIDRAAPSDRELLARFVAALPDGARASLNAMPTWVAAVAITFAREYRAGDAPGPGADDWLEAHFRALGRPVDAIEQGDRVIASVNAIPEADQRAMLSSALRAPTRSIAAIRAPTHAWARGEVGEGSPLTVDLDGATGTKALTSPLLTTRNLQWTDRLIERLKQPGTTLFAAGAGHFVGRGSVIDLLRQRGITVERVD